MTYPNDHTPMQLPPMRFALGRLGITPAALDALSEIGRHAGEYVSRHVQGDWGDLSADDQAANELAVLDGSRILSAYALDTQGHTKLYVLTEADRSSTTILLSYEY